MEAAGCAAEMTATLAGGGLFAAIVMIGLIFIGPGLFALTVGLIEIMFLGVTGTAVAAGRVLFGQPWEVIARRDGETCAWHVFGHRGARALVTEVETAIALGADPTTVRPDALDRHTLDSTAETLRLYRRNGFRWLGNVFGLLLGAAGIALVFVVGVLAA